jgi:hypothetical protein
MAGNIKSGLTFVLDHNLGKNVLQILRLAKVQPEGLITSLEEMGIPGETPDEAWLMALRQKGGCVAVTRDGEILNAAVRRAAWRASGVSLLLLDKKWGLVPIKEIARTLLFWWPHMVEHAYAGVAGSAWTVSPNIPAAPSKGIRLVRPPEDA